VHYISDCPVHTPHITNKPVVTPAKNKNFAFRTILKFTKNENFVKAKAQLGIGVVNRMFIFEGLEPHIQETKKYVETEKFVFFLKMGILESQMSDLHGRETMK